MSQNKRDPLVAEYLKALAVRSELFKLCNPNLSGTNEGVAQQTAYGKANDNVNRVMDCLNARRRS